MALDLVNTRWTKTGGIEGGKEGDRQSGRGGRKAYSIFSI